MQHRGRSISRDAGSIDLRCRIISRRSVIYDEAVATHGPKLEGCERERVQDVSSRNKSTESWMPKYGGPCTKDCRWVAGEEVPERAG